MPDRDQPDRHEMVRTAAAGAEEWSCTTCSRRIRMEWPPHYRRTVLDPGDDSAVHAGGAGGLHLTGTHVDAGGGADPAAHRHDGGDAEWLAANGIAWDPD